MLGTIPPNRIESTPPMAVEAAPVREAAEPVQAREPEPAAAGSAGAPPEADPWAA